MAKIVLDFAISENDNLDFEFVQYSFNEAVIVLEDNSDRVELQFNRKQLNQLKTFLQDNEIAKF